jgi:hypothetical protein
MMKESREKGVAGPRVRTLNYFSSSLSSKLILVKRKCGYIQCNSLSWSIKMLRVSVYFFLCLTLLDRTNWLARWEFPSRFESEKKSDDINQDISVAASFPTKSSMLEKFLEIRLCKGLCNQILALQEGIFISYLLNLTFVLPDVVWDYG